MKKISLGILLFLVPVLTGFYLVTNRQSLELPTQKIPLLKRILPRHQVIGFLPYWLINKADIDYSPYITHLTYFSLSLNPDGSIQTHTRPTETEPGYYSLTSGKADAALAAAKAKNLDLSLAVFSSDDITIAAMLDNPQASAQNLLTDLAPLMKTYGFTDLNIDIEPPGSASEAARAKFTQFVQAVAAGRDPEIIHTISVDVTASSFVKTDNLADPESLAPLVDRVIIMAYDFHYRGSYVTGPVAPAGGAGIVSEFDTHAAIETALTQVPAQKIILGIPTYGYEWETIDPATRSAVIASTGMTISNARAEEFLAACSSCSAVFDPVDQENYFVYKDQQTGTYHQVFYPDAQATAYKIDLAKTYSLGGLAIWALGYEGSTILEPLAAYRN